MSAFDPKRTLSLGSLMFSHEQEVAAVMAGVPRVGMDTERRPFLELSYDFVA